MSPRLADEAAAFGLALRFLTRLPLGGGGYTPARMAAATGYLPVVGVLIGICAAVVFLAAGRLFPPVVAVILAVGATCLLTGALHEDGLADTADGLGGGATRERALEIMRDSRIGSYGALALGLTLAVRIAALAAMPAATAAAALVAANGAGRASAVLVVASSRYARPGGAGAFTAGGVGRGGLVVTLVTGALCLGLVGVVAGWGAAAGGAAGVALAHLASRVACERRLGGYTGDTLGATEQLGEAGLVLGLLACL